MIIAICNHKGGTGKTTTTINVGRALTLNNKSVLLIDLDSQANLTYSLGLTGEENCIGEVLLKRKSISEAIVHAEGMDVIPATNKLFRYEETITKNNYRHNLLKDVLGDVHYDFVLIDCPPSYSTLNLNAFCAADRILVPMLLDVLSVQGLNQIIERVDEIRETMNPGLEILGVLGVLVDERRQLTRDILQYIQSNYSVTVFNNHIRANVKAAEAPSFGKSVIEYAPDSNSSKDYQSVCKELLKIITVPN